MKELENMLENWRNLSNANKVIENDYYIYDGDKVRLTVAVAIEKLFLYKSFYAECHLNRQEIENAIERLEEIKDELI